MQRRSSGPKHDLGPDFEIVTSSAGSHRPTRVLADGRSFAAFNVGGDIVRSPLEALGFYHRDTRHLSQFELTIAGQAPHLLNSYLSDDRVQLRVNMTNPDLRAVNGGGRLRRDDLQIQRSWILADPVVLHRLVIHNFSGQQLRLPVEIRFNVDFSDLFEARGLHRINHGAGAAPTVHGNQVRFAYRGLDNVERCTIVEFSRKPRVLDESHAEFIIDMEPRGGFEIETYVVAEHAGEKPPLHRRERSFEQALRTREAEVSVLKSDAAAISASNELVGALLGASYADLMSLTSLHGDRSFIMGGIPWFATLFGRDSIITSMSMLPFMPRLAERTLRALASLQGKTVDPSRDEQPGKIIHEIRFGEMAATGEIPFGHYYGNIDGTPLFVWLYSKYVFSTGDLKFAEDLWPNVQSALAWIENYGDRDGDGFVEYFCETPRGLANQGWKDSFDSISHADGRLADAPIALCEVQGYVYAAYLGAADVASLLGHRNLPDILRERANALKKSFLRKFWLDDKGIVALALDRDKKPCSVMASNVGHCMAAGLLEGDYLSALASRLTADDMFSGWGVRTLSALERRYNPMGYHNGSVWPHDNAFVASGLAKIKGRKGVLDIFEGLLNAAVHLNTGSLPELFCGFPRESRLGPVPYPVACHPQAWSAASIMMVVQEMIGMQVKALEHKVVFHLPVLPSFVDWLRIEDLRVGSDKISFVVRRTPTGAAIEMLKKEGSVSIEVHK